MCMPGEMTAKLLPGNEQDKKQVSFLQPKATPNEGRSIDSETASVEAKPDVHIPRDTSHEHSVQLATDREFSQWCLVVPYCALLHLVVLSCALLCIVVLS